MRYDRMKRLGILMILIGILPFSSMALESEDQVKINELYYTGTPFFTYQDQFVELYNAGATTAYLDGALLIRGVDTMGTRVYRFPGVVDGTLYPIEPGEFKVVAQDAYDFWALDSTSVDLSVADFETFFFNEEEPGDNPAVPNLSDAIENEVDFIMDRRVGQVLLATGDSLEVIPCPTS